MMPVTDESVRMRAVVAAMAMRRRAPQSAAPWPSLCAWGVTVLVHGLLGAWFVQRPPQTPFEPAPRMTVYLIDTAEPAPAPIPLPPEPAPPPRSARKPPVAAAPGRIERPASQSAPAQSAASHPVASAAPAASVPVAAVPAEPRTESAASAPAPAGVAVAAADAIAMRDSWEARLLAHLEAFRRYPLAAQRRREQGTAWLRFTVDPRGRVLARHLDRGSGSDALDEESLAVVLRAQPLPPPPAALASGQVEVVLPMEFRLRRR